MAKRDKQINRQLEKAGWHIHRDTGKHEIWACPCGQHPLVTKAHTVGQGRGVKNLRSFLKNKDRFGDCAICIKLG